MGSEALSGDKVFGDVLSSDILKRKYGPLEVDVMLHDKSKRVIATRSVGDGRVLEISWSVFMTDAAESFPEVFQAMSNGESMGEAFSSRGIKFRRARNSAYTYDLPPAFYRWFGGVEGATVMDITARVGHDEKPFARILETYRPGSMDQLSPLPDELPMEIREQLDILGDFLETRPKSN